MAGEMAFCPRCGTARTPGMGFCAKCGLDLAGGLATPTSAQAVRSEPVVYETVEIVDRDSGEMPLRANAVATVFGTNAVIRHHLIARHRWPGGSEEFPVAEYGLDAGETPEQMHDRHGIQQILDEVRDWLVDGDFEEEPLGPVWYALRFRRAIEPGQEAGPIAPPEAVVAMEAVREKAAKKALRESRPMGTSLGLGTLIYWFGVLVLAWFIGSVGGAGNMSRTGWIELIVIVLIVVWRVREYRAWKAREFGE